MFREKGLRKVEVYGLGHGTETADFHGWGNDVEMHESYESDGANFAVTVAIVELEDGRVVKIDPGDIQFIKDGGV